MKLFLFSIMTFFGIIGLFKSKKFGHLDVPSHKFDIC